MGWVTLVGGFVDWMESPVTHTYTYLHTKYTPSPVPTYPVVNASFPEGCTASAVTGPLCPPSTCSRLQS